MQKIVTVKSWLVKHWGEILGWIGMAMLQFNAVPAIHSALVNGTSTPKATVMLTIGGLTCYLIRAICRYDMLYLVGNMIGLIGNLILLWVLL